MFFFMIFFIYFCNRYMQKNGMSNYSQAQEAKERKRDNEKVTKEKAAGYFFDMSKLCFASAAIGSITPLISSELNSVNWIAFISGLAGTMAFALIAFVILKQR